MRPTCDHEMKQCHCLDLTFTSKRCFFSRFQQSPLSVSVTVEISFLSWTYEPDDNTACIEHGISLPAQGRRAHTYNYGTRVNACIEKIAAEESADHPKDPSKTCLANAVKHLSKMREFSDTCTPSIIDKNGEFDNDTLTLNMEKVEWDKHVSKGKC